MDRFAAAETDFQDDVPKNPMSKFVKSGDDQNERSFMDDAFQAQQIVLLLMMYTRLMPMSMSTQTYSKRLHVLCSPICIQCFVWAALSPQDYNCSFSVLLPKTEGMVCEASDSIATCSTISARGLWQGGNPGQQERAETGTGIIASQKHAGSSQQAWQHSIDPRLGWSAREGVNVAGLQGEQIDRHHLTDQGHDSLWQVRSSADKTVNKPACAVH